MKTCTKCGRELDDSMFYVNNANKDAHDTFCKECRKALNRAYRQNKDVEVKVKEGLIKVYSDPDLAKFTPRQLMAELKSRGYRWNYMLEPQRKVMYDKI